MGRESHGNPLVKAYEKPSIGEEKSSERRDGIGSRPESLTGVRECDFKEIRAVFSGESKYVFVTNDFPLQRFLALTCSA